MSRVAKTWLIIAAVLVAVGVGLFSAVMTANNWDFTRLNTVAYETNIHTVTEEFHDISMNTDTADIVFLLSEDAICKAVCYEQNDLEHAVTVRDGVLTVSQVDDRAWLEKIGVSVGTPKITVYLPETEYATLLIKENTGDVQLPKGLSFENIDISVTTGDVKSEASASGCVEIKTSTGDIRVGNTTAGAFRLAVSTGKVFVESVLCEGDVQLQVATGDARMTDVLCRSITSKGNTGDVYLSNVLAAGTVSIERSTGDVFFEKSDAATLYVKTETGDVKGDLLSQKVFITQADTGRVDVPKTEKGGKCELITNTGDIKITLSEAK